MNLQENATQMVKFKRAVMLLEHVIAAEAKILSEDHPDRLASTHELARVYQADGQLQRAVEFLEQVVAIKKNTLREDHSDRLASQHILARVCQAGGQPDRALELLEI